MATARARALTPGDAPGGRAPGDSPGANRNLDAAALDPRSWTGGCVAVHAGLWAVEVGWFRRALAALEAGNAAALSALTLRAARGDVDGPDAAAGDERRPLYTLSGGIAHVRIVDQMQKPASKFGGTSTIRVRRAIRAAVGDREARGILLHVDSPGGTAAGTDALARDVAAAGAVKPLSAHIEDLGASAAYWVASAASAAGGRLTASPTSEVGSIGTYAWIPDSRQMYEQAGITVHLVTSGGMKGAFAEGSKVTKEQLAYAQGLVDVHFEHFLDAVAAGRRNLSRDRIAELADGRLHDAAEAVALGLIDAVVTDDEAIGLLAGAIGGRAAARTRRGRAAMSLARARAAR